MIACRVFAIVCLSTGLLMGQNPFPNKCADNQPLPFAAIELQHPIDSACAIEGKPSSSAPSHEQNKAKNNFCAAGPAEPFTIDKLVQFQRDHNFPAGQGQEPPDRAPLRQAGEGKLIRVKGFLIEAHHADLGTGESVNCGRPNEGDNDVHIALGSKASSQECSSVSAEISPHFRPKSWNEIGHYENWNASSRNYVVNQAMASRLTAHPYRITGQLFYDASHAPCPCGTHCSPTRSSDWEIHPVYAIEVCKSGTSCDEANDSDWLAFDAWWNSLAPIQKTKPPHKHVPHEPTKKKSSTTHPKKNG